MRIQQVHIFPVMHCMIYNMNMGRWYLLNDKISASTAAYGYHVLDVIYDLSRKPRTLNDYITSVICTGKWNFSEPETSIICHVCSGAQSTIHKLITAGSRKLTDNVCLLHGKTLHHYTGMFHVCTC